ncbi:unnamed protein product [Amoebophrya sp. A120]|nr:unnamed protein product [Amoebophrya sp. A120]|eukprot:GSA120T00011564001.1
MPGYPFPPQPMGESWPSRGLGLEAAPELPSSARPRGALQRKWAARARTENLNIMLTDEERALLAQNRRANHAFVRPHSAVQEMLAYATVPYNEQYYTSSPRRRRRSLPLGRPNGSTGRAYHAKRFGAPVSPKRVVVSPEVYYGVLSPSPSRRSLGGGVGQAQYVVAGPERLRYEMEVPPRPAQQPVVPSRSVQFRPPPRVLRNATAQTHVVATNSRSRASTSENASAKLVGQRADAEHSYAARYSQSRKSKKSSASSASSASSSVISKQRSSKTSARDSERSGPEVQVVPGGRGSRASRSSLAGKKSKAKPGTTVAASNKRKKASILELEDYLIRVENREQEQKRKDQGQEGQEVAAVESSRASTQKQKDKVKALEKKSTMEEAIVDAAAPPAPVATGQTATAVKAPAQTQADVESEEESSSDDLGTELQVGGSGQPPATAAAATSGATSKQKTTVVAKKEPEDHGNEDSSSLGELGAPPAPALSREAAAKAHQVAPVKKTAAVNKAPEDDTSESEEEETSSEEEDHLELGISGGPGAPASTMQVKNKGPEQHREQQKNKNARVASTRNQGEEEKESARASAAEAVPPAQPGSSATSRSAEKEANRPKTTNLRDLLNSADRPKTTTAPEGKTRSQLPRNKSKGAKAVYVVPPAEEIEVVYLSPRSAGRGLFTGTKGTNKQFLPKSRKSSGKLKKRRKAEIQAEEDAPSSPSSAKGRPKTVNVDAIVPAHMRYAQTFEVVFANYLTTSVPLREFLVDNVQQVKVSALTFEAIELAPALLRWKRTTARTKKDQLTVCDLTYLLAFCVTQRKQTLLRDARAAGEFVFDVMLELRDAVAASSEKSPNRLPEPEELLVMAEDAFSLLLKYTKLEKGSLKLWQRRTDSMLLSGSTSPADHGAPEALVHVQDHSASAATSNAKNAKNGTHVAVDSNSLQDEISSLRARTENAAPVETVVNQTAFLARNSVTTADASESRAIPKNAAATRAETSEIRPAGRLVLNTAPSPKNGSERRDEAPNVAAVHPEEAPEELLFADEQSLPSASPPAISPQDQLLSVLHKKDLMTARGIDVTEVMRLEKEMPAAGRRTGVRNPALPTVKEHNLAQRKQRLFGVKQPPVLEGKNNASTSSTSRDHSGARPRARLVADAEDEPPSYLDEISVRRGRGACGPPGGMSYSAYGKYICGGEMEARMVAMEQDALKRTKAVARRNATRPNANATNLMSPELATTFTL